MNLIVEKDRLFVPPLYRLFADGAPVQGWFMRYVDVNVFKLVCGRYGVPQIARVNLLEAKALLMAQYVMEKADEPYT